MKRDEYNNWRRNANKQPDDYVDTDIEWDERDEQCVHCYHGDDHTWQEHDERIDRMRSIKRSAWA
jgi:hypothetical protein